MRPFSLILDLLLLGGISLLGYIYFPYIALFLPFQKPQIVASYTIQIPKINAKALIVDNIERSDKTSYQRALEMGVGKVGDSSGFGQEGTNFLIAHAPLDPWVITRRNSSFLRLNELENGDEIIIDNFGELLTYQVTTKKEAWETEVEGTLAAHKGNLVIQTCMPLGTCIKKLLILPNQLDNWARK